MFTLIRLVFLVLALPFFAATSTADPSPIDNGVVASLGAKLSVAESKFASAPFEIGTYAKNITAALEDGPEGEEAPLVSLLRSTNGDDQIQTSHDFTLIAFSYAVLTPDIDGVAPAQGHFPFAGLPTGPPAA